MGDVISILGIANDNGETGDDILAGMAGCTVEYKGRVNKYHRINELMQEYTAKLLNEMEK